ncbi:MAG: thioredoxin domain-containing protein [Minisyncoccia bacterium]
MDDQKQKKSAMEVYAIPLSIVIAGAIMAGALYYSNLKVKTQEAVIDTVQKVAEGSVVKMRPVTAEDHILGNPSAEVIIVEYSDTECPFCKQFHNTLRRVMNDYGKDGKVAWVYRHFPIDSLHSKARKEAEATECANDLGGPAKFWEYINLLYDTTQSNNSLDLAKLPEFAKAIGLDVKAFNACLSSGKFAAKVEADYQDAIGAGGQGTPNSIIITKDGTKTNVPGAQPYESLKSIIDAILNK